MRANVGAIRRQIVKHPNGESPARRLPGYDSGTRRMEMGAFCLLGSIAIIMIMLAVANAVRFSENRDEIAVTLSSGEVVVMTHSSARDTNHVLTNVTLIPTFAPGAPVGANQSASHQS